jgi:2-(1,2-epoxy-1,2-dihydrophenyl)acetyl-CoA isomerase
MSKDYSDFEDLVVDVDDAGVAVWRINRPEKLNAIRTPTFWEIIELGHRLQADPDVRAVVGTHEGRGFSAGADLTSGGAASEPSWVEASDPVGISGIGMAMPGIDKPTIAAINGVAAGGGMAVALSFDIRFVGPNARFTTVFARRALAPDCGISYFLPRLVGNGRALELLYTAREVGPEEAVRIGLANELVDDPFARAMELARELAAGPPLAYLRAKRDVRNSWHATLAQQVEYEWFGQKSVTTSEDVREGRAAFVEKRPPHFTGR